VNRGIYTSFYTPFVLSLRESHLKRAMSAPPESTTASNDVSVSQATEPAQDGTEPASEWDSLLVQLVKNPYEPPKWYRVVEIAEGSGELPKIQAAYDGLLNAYPNTVREPPFRCKVLVK
jgi:hypothetical protein